MEVRIWTSFTFIIFYCFYCFYHYIFSKNIVVLNFIKLLQLLRLAILDENLEDHRQIVLSLSAEIDQIRVM